jgi:hypothetical protein
MLLTTRFARSAARDDGSVLIPVIAVMAVGLIVGGVLSTTIVSGMRYSSSTRAGVQSQAAADAGVAAARAGLYAGNCTLQSTLATYASTGSIYYSAKVQQMVSGVWQTGCPANPTPQVRIISTGRAVGSAGIPYGTPTKVEAIYNFLWPGVTPSGAGIFLNGGAIVGANSALDLSEGGLVVKNGNFTCAKNNTVLNGDVVVTGNLVLSSSGVSCAVNGNAWVSGAVTLGTKGSISGKLSAGSVSPTHPSPSQLGGAYTPGGALPALPPWTDVPYTPSDWVDSTGTPYQVVNLSGSSCTQAGGSFGGSAGQPTIINALACPNGIQVSNNTTFKLTSDVVIYALTFNWGSINQLNFASSNTTEHRLWFITPDYLKDGQPTCPPPVLPSVTPNTFAINNGFQIQAPIDAMLYTPCAFNGKNGFTWRGQIYAGSGDLENNPSFTFISVGMDGYDLGTGTRSTGVTTPQPGTLVSNRNINFAP